MLLNFIKSEWYKGNITIKSYEKDGKPDVWITPFHRRVTLLEHLIKLLSEKDREALHELAKERERIQREEARVALDKRYELEQKELEVQFQENPPLTVCVNIWDDYCDEEKPNKTDAYVEADTPESFNKGCLTFLKEHIEKYHQSTLLPDCQLSMKFHDSAEVYPNLLATEHEPLLFRRWQLVFSHIPSHRRVALVNALRKDRLAYQGVEIDIISES